MSLHFLELISGNSPFVCSVFMNTLTAMAHCLDITLSKCM